MHTLRVQVRICRERTTGKICAMKKLRKSEMVRRGQVRVRLSDRNIPQCTGSARPHLPNRVTCDV